MMQDVIAKLDRPRAGDAMQLSNIESELRKLATRVDGAVEAPQEMINILRKDLAGLHRRLDILSENAQDTSAIRHLNMRVSQLSDQIETLQRDPKTFAGLETVITKLNEKIDSFAQAERDQDVVIKLRDEVLRLTQRIDANPPENLSPALKMLEQVQHHLERLSQNAPTREDRARVQGLETAVRDLHKQVADLRENIKDGISKSTASLSASFSDATAASIERELTKLRQQQEHSDRQTAHTLASLHQTMQSVIERISTLENEDDELRASPARNQSPALGDLSRLDIRAEELLSPGQGRPGHSEDATAPTLPSPSAATASQASFIAAARRAARAAQEAAERAEKQDVAQRRQLLKVDFFATMLKKQKRNAVVGLTSLAVIIAAVQAMRFIPDDKPVAKVAAPKTVTAPAKTAVASPQQDKAMLSNQPVATLGNMVNASPINTVKASAVDPNPMGNGVTTTLAPRIRVSDAAAKGDAAAQFELGMRYLDGRGMAQDAQQALNWLSKAAQQNLAPAQFRLASMHERGVGTPKDLKRARELYLKAAQQGHARSMHNLGVLYAEGAEGKPDYTTALTWFKKAAELGVRDSQFNLAILYARGMGTEQNIVQGWVWFNAATQQGDVDAGRKRDEIATRMTATQISTAKSQADSLKIRKPDVAANDVLPPAGGWDETPELSVQSKPPATSATVNPRVSKL
jgi:localization factor PodJL